MMCGSVISMYRNDDVGLCWSLNSFTLQSVSMFRQFERCMVGWINIIKMSFVVTCCAPKSKWIVLFPLICKALLSTLSIDTVSEIFLGFFFKKKNTQIYIQSVTQNNINIRFPCWRPICHRNDLHFLILIEIFQCSNQIDTWIYTNFFYYYSI